MAYAMTKQGSLDNCITYEFICDTVTDMNAIENKYKTIGTVAIVLTGENGGLEVYICGSNKKWSNLSAMNIDNGSTNRDGLIIHICTQNEVNEGLPNIEGPNESTIYLVSSGDTSGDLYKEYIYVNNNWELFSNGAINIDSKADKRDTILETTLSRGRKQDTTIGSGSFAFGNDVEATTDYSHAEGDGTSATGTYSPHAEGYYTVASGDYGSHAEGCYTVASGGDGSHAEGYSTMATSLSAHAEGYNTKATNEYSHAEGYMSEATGLYSSHAEGYYTISSGGSGSHAEGSETRASGSSSHAEGLATVAAGNSSHVGGTFNVTDSYGNWAEWVANTSYAVGDRVKVTSSSNNKTVVTGYICKKANSDFSFTSSKWTNDKGKMNFAEIVGNGETNNSRSNARALDWKGNEYLMSDVYVGCNADSTGGTKLARIPDPPTTDGTYTLQATVASGVITYSWIAGA